MKSANYRLQLVTCTRLLIVGLGVACADQLVPAIGAEGSDARSNATSGIRADIVDGGGGNATSSAYEVDASLGGIGGYYDGGVIAAAQGFIGQLEAVIVGRRLFYNESAWDQNEPRANVSDDDAIAADKLALLPGQSASFVNVSSYSRGLNGVIIDLLDLPAELSPGHFAFRVGNNNTPSNWESPPAPVSLAIRWGAGAGGADRITMIWPNNAIQKQWLEVRIKSGLATGLGNDEIFYFGNAVGDTGDAMINNRLLVNTADEAGARLNPRNADNPALLSDLYDFNRDRRVDSNDEAIARVNPANFLTGLILIIPPGGQATRQGLQHNEMVEPVPSMQWKRVSSAPVFSGENLLAIQISAKANDQLGLQVCEKLGDGDWRPWTGSEWEVQADQWTSSAMRDLIEDITGRSGMNSQKQGAVWTWTVPISEGAPVRFFRVVRIAERVDNQNNMRMGSTNQDAGER